MAIVFSEQRKKQQLLVIAFIIVATLSGAVFWFGFIRETEDSIPLSFPEKRVEINYSILENPIFSKLNSFDFIPKVEEPEKEGRSNPFLPYTPSSPSPSPSPSPQENF